MIREHFDLGIVYPMIYPNKYDTEYKETFENILKDTYFSIIEIGKLPKNLETKLLQDSKSSKTLVFYSAIGGLLENKLNLNSLDEELRKKSVEHIKSELDTGKVYGAKTLTLISGNFEDNKLDEHMKALECSLKEIIDYTKEIQGPSILLEAFDSHMDKRALIGPANLAKQICEVLDKDNFGLLIDLSHIPMLGEDIDYTLNTLSKYIKHLHIGNTVLKEESHLYGDSHPCFGHKDGVNDIQEISIFLKNILNSNYMNSISKPTLSFEVKPYDGQDSQVIISNCKRSLRGALLNIMKDGGNI